MSWKRTPSCFANMGQPPCTINAMCQEGYFFSFNSRAFRLHCGFILGIYCTNFGRSGVGQKPPGLTNTGKLGAAVSKKRIIHTEPAVLPPNTRLQEDSRVASRPRKVYRVPGLRKGKASNNCAPRNEADVRSYVPCGPCGRNHKNTWCTFSSFQTTSPGRKNVSSSFQNPVRFVSSMFFRRCLFFSIFRCRFSKMGDDGRLGHGLMRPSWKN